MPAMRILLLDRCTCSTVGRAARAADVEGGCLETGARQHRHRWRLRPAAAVWVLLRRACIHLLAMCAAGLLPSGLRRACGSGGARGRQQLALLSALQQQIGALLLDSVTANRKNVGKVRVTANDCHRFLWVGGQAGGRQWLVGGQ